MVMFDEWNDFYFQLIMKWWKVGDSFKKYVSEKN